MKNNYEIREIDFKTAMDILIPSHYLHRQAPYSHAYGLFEKKTNKIVGVANYGVPCSPTLLNGLFGSGESHNIYELNRIWLHPSVPKRGREFLINNTKKLLDKEIIICFVNEDYENIMRSSCKKCSFLYLGTTIKFYDYVVRGKEHIHRRSYAKGLTVSDLKKKYGASNVYRVERPAKHRYLYINGNKKRKDELLKKLNYSIIPH